MSKKTDNQNELFAKLDFYQRILDNTLRFIHEINMLPEYREYMDEVGDIQFELPDEK